MCFASAEFAQAPYAGAPFARARMGPVQVNSPLVSEFDIGMFSLLFKLTGPKHYYNAFSYKQG